MEDLISRIEQLKRAVFRNEPPCDVPMGRAYLERFTREVWDIQNAIGTRISELRTELLRCHEEGAPGERKESVRFELGFAHQTLRDLRAFDRSVERKVVNTIAQAQHDG